MASPVGRGFNGRGNTPPSAVKPEGEWKFPEFHAARPLFSMITLEGREHLCVFDMRKPGERMYTRIWFDRDCNRDLTDESPVDCTVSEEKGLSTAGMARVKFPGIFFTPMYRGRKMLCCLDVKVFELTSSLISGHIDVSYTYQIAYAGYGGEFTAGEKRYAFLVMDGDSNGRFDDYAKISDRINFSEPPRGDFVFLTEGKKAVPHDAQLLGNFLLAGESLFEIRIDIPQKKLILDEVRKNRWPLKLTLQPERLSLFSEESGNCIMAIHPKGDEIRLPAGNYRLLGYQVLRRDSQGDLWRLQARGTRSSPKIGVGPNLSPVLSLGEPFAPKIRLQRYFSSREGETHLLDFILYGRMMEAVIDLTRIEGSATRLPLSKNPVYRNSVLEPFYAIVKDDGEIVAKGKFEYG